MLAVNIHWPLVDTLASNRWHLISAVYVVKLMGLKDYMYIFVKPTKGQKSREQWNKNIFFQEKKLQKEPTSFVNKGTTLGRKEEKEKWYSWVLSMASTHLKSVYSQISLPKEGWRKWNSDCYRYRQFYFIHSTHTNPWFNRAFLSMYSYLDIPILTNCRLRTRTKWWQRHCSSFTLHFNL